MVRVLGRMPKQYARDAEEFLEGKLKLTLNMEKIHITHVNDGFAFRTIPWDKYRALLRD
ncbi:hypothetical protein [Nitrosovibrio tenuis]|uniref:Uncharacterized protein n=1 Tax=Nitrosovibrio tenuis TaxID=1233 RepID=A0A1H7PE23_9PROT|nr:hypothetical protein [Nitrosovibrio tenuis]SEL34020.1 hypothetical protein SAMN05216387_1094 [Nitrosovibrio tenuis]